MSGLYALLLYISLFSSSLIPMSRVEEYTTSRREHRPRVATWRRSLIKSLDTVRAQYPSLDTQQERRTIDNWVMEVKNIFGLWTGEFLNRDIREMADVDYLRKQFSAMAEAIKESSVSEIRLTRTLMTLIQPPGRNFSNKSKGGLRIYKTPNEIVEGMHARQARIVFSHPLINHIDGILNVGGLCGLDKTMLDAWKEEAYKVFGLPDAVTEEISSNSDVLFLTRRFDALGDLIRDKNPLIVRTVTWNSLPHTESSA